MKKIVLVSLFLALPLFGARCTLFGGPGQNLNDAGVFQSGDYGTSWQPVNFVDIVDNRPVTLNHVITSALIVHPTDPATIYLVSRNDGLYRTVNAGGQWQKMNGQLGTVNRLAIDPQTPETLYAARGGDILKSVDSGVNWEIIYIESRSDQAITAVLIDSITPTNIYAVTNKGLILFSTDSGHSWSVKATLNFAIRDFWADPTTPTTFLLVGEGRGIWRSTDSGGSWEEISVDLKKVDKRAYRIHDLDIKRTDPKSILVGTDHGLILTTDGGISWQVVPTTLAPNTLPVRTVAFDSEGKPIIYFTVDNKVHRSTDNGSSWTISAVATTKVINELVINPDNSAVMYVGVEPRPKK